MSDASEPTARWRALLAEAGPRPHLSDPWIAYRRAQGATPRFALVCDARGAIAAGVLYLRRARMQPWARPSVALDVLPVLGARGRERAAVDPAAAHAGIARALIERARERRWERLEIESFGGPTPPPDLAALGCETRLRHEYLLDLSAPAAARFAALKASHRRKVRDAERAGLAVADETGSAGLDLLRELQLHTRERRAERGEEMALPDAAAYERLAASFVAGGGARLFVGRLGGEAVSAVLCGVAGANAYYFMGGTSPAGLECNAATLVLWKAAELLAAAGVTSFNLGGVPASAQDEGDPQHGLARFKEGFGAARVDCASGIWSRGR